MISLSLHVAPKRKARTIAEYRRILRSNVTPAIGQKRIIELRRADVAKLHAKFPAALLSDGARLALRRDMKA